MEKKIRELKLEETQAVVGGALSTSMTSYTTISYATTAVAVRPVSWSPATSLKLP